MDAHALLTSQGWRGTGNSLHPTDNAIGIAKPLLVSRKDNNHGVGKKQHKTSDMWWMNAFDKSLQGLDTSKEGVVVQTAMSGGLDIVKRGGAKWILDKGGLYGSFVRGESLKGTITLEVGKDLLEEKKRKREGETKEERRARKAARREREDSLAVKVPAETVEDADRPMKGGDFKKTQKTAKIALGNIESNASHVIMVELTKPSTMAESKEERRTKKASNEQDELEVSTTTPTTVVEAVCFQEETKQERKERRRLKKKSKELAASSAEDLSETGKRKRRRKEQIS